MRMEFRFSRKHFSRILGSPRSTRRSSDEGKSRAGIPPTSARNFSTRRDTPRLFQDSLLGFIGAIARNTQWIQGEPPLAPMLLGGTAKPKHGVSAEQEN